METYLNFIQHVIICHVKIEEVAMICGLFCEAQEGRCFVQSLLPAFEAPQFQVHAYHKPESAGVPPSKLLPKCQAHSLL